MAGLKISQTKQESRILNTLTLYSESLEITDQNGCIIHVVYWEAPGGLMVGTLVSGSSGRALAGVIMLGSWSRHFTLAVLACEQAPVGDSRAQSRTNGMSRERSGEEGVRVHTRFARGVTTL